VAVQNCDLLAKHQFLDDPQPRPVFGLPKIQEGPLIGIGVFHLVQLMRLYLGRPPEPSDDSNGARVDLSHELDLMISLDNITLIDTQLIDPE
jgi:hypothetical protein